MSVDEADASQAICGYVEPRASQKPRYELLPNFSHVNKPALREQILEKLREELALQQKAAALAHQESIDEESRPRSKYDTHSVEAAYLAQGQAKLAAEIQTSLEVYASLPLPEFGPGAAVDIGALVELDAGSRRSWYFVGPRAGGLEFSYEGRDVLILTPLSPLGRELVGRHVGDRVDTPARGGATVTHEIVAVE
jgi:transcription elongation GreA/GreB family factor